MNFESFARLLQFSISPIALISGASLLLLSITNRLGRTIDRSRILVRELESGSGPAFKEEHKTQLRILLVRSRFLRNAVLAIIVSIFLSALMIIGIAAQVFAGWDMKTAILLFLSFGVLALCIAVIFLFLDVSLGLKALKLEIHRHI